MASWGSFNVQDEASVKAWMERARALNERAAKAVQEAQDALKEFSVTAEGVVFDQVVEMSQQVITGMTDILSGMNKILEVVNNLMTAVANKLRELAEAALGIQRQNV